MPRSVQAAEEGGDEVEPRGRPAKMTPRITIKPVKKCKKTVAPVNSALIFNFALAAWLVFQEALSQERGVREIFGRVGEYYRRHWFLPARFEPGTP